MSSVSNKKVAFLIDDVQSRVDTRNIPIDRVGIRAIRHPISIRTRDGKLQNTVGEFSMYVNLAHDTKGTHMSRFVELLHGEELALCPSSFRTLLESMTQRLEAERGHIEVKFAYFVAKKAPVSGVVSYLDYQVSLIGEIGKAGPEVRVKVVVPVTSLCPCSKEISKYGAHNQRSHVTVDALVEGDIAIEDLIDICEEQASCELYGILKRPDEKYVTERAYENPKFVEDMVRDVAAALNANDKISQYTVESENFESIHNHSAYATITFDKRA